MQTGRSEIFQQDQNSDRFAKQVKEVEAKLADDKAVNAVISTLRSHQLSLNGKNDPTLFNSSRCGKKKFWYYRQKLHQKFKGYFPDTLA